MYAVANGQVVSTTADVREIGAYVANNYVQVTIMSGAGQPLVSRWYDSSTGINPYDWAFGLLSEAGRFR